MRSLIALVGVLILIAAITPAASAFGEYAGNITLPRWFNTSSAEASALCAEHGTTYSGGYIAGAAHYNADWSWRGQNGADGDFDLYDTGDPGAYYFSHQVTCANSGIYTLRYYIQGPTLPLNADFYATPVQGTGPVDITLTDNSTGTITAYLWEITPWSGWSVNPYDLDNEDVTIRFTTNGNYTVNHTIYNTTSYDSEIKTNYIWIHDSNATVTTPFTAVDLAFAHPITGANISLYDIGNSSWTNGTTGADGKVSITTLQGHYINGYASAAGYDDADLLGVDAYAGGHTFYMYPQGYTNVSEWNVTVFINVVDDSDFGVPLTGVTVTGMYGSTSQTQTSDSAGIARFVFPNSTDIHFGATKAGYAGTTITLNTGIPSGGSAAITGTIHMFKGAVTTAPTPTTLPGGGTPTVTITVDPYPCVGDGSYQDTLNCQRKQGEMGADLIAYGPDLVKFFIMLTFVGGLALMGKGFK